MNPVLRSAARKQGGLTLIDVMVATVLFSVGVLGMVAMQVTMMKTQANSEDRAAAASLADELIADCEMLYATSSTCAVPSSSSDSSWATKLAKLPGSTTAGTPAATLTGPTSNGVWTVTVTWTEPTSSTGAVTPTKDSYFTEFTLP